jgi:HEPN domain-containing protein
LNNIEMAKSYVRQAEERLRHAKEAFEEENYPYVVRQCQEAVELLLKAALRIAGIEPPKWHDVGPVLRRESNRFPEWFQKEIKRLSIASRKLRREREPSMYGDEESGTSPDELYYKEDAEEALNQADYVHNIVKRLLEAYQAP